MQRITVVLLALRDASGRKARRWLSAVLLIGLIACVLPSTASAEVQQTRIQDDPLEARSAGTAYLEALDRRPTRAQGDSEAAALASDWHVPLSEAVRRVRRQDAVDALYRSLRDQPGYGGIFIDHANGGQVVVSALPQQADEIGRKARGSFPEPGLLRVALADASAAQLQQIYDGVSSRIGRQLLPGKSRS